ncbi:hypothetical protein [Flagellimonas sp.]|uniref:hypothetical protein n=1 Tax=Flagellimonas sp. TaxID=2058762 RepID=UPI003B5CA615
MKRKAVIYVMLVLLFSCSKGDDNSSQPSSLLGRIEKVCSKANTSSIKEKILTYLNEESSTQEYQYVLKGEYNGNAVFVFGNCCPFCNTVTQVFDCSGNLLGYVDYSNSGKENAINDNKITNKENLWPKTPNCNFKD